LIIFGGRPKPSFPRKRQYISGSRAHGDTASEVRAAPEAFALLIAIEGDFLQNIPE
jgi:hypothetical protein